VAAPRLFSRRTATPLRARFQATAHLPTRDCRKRSTSDTDQPRKCRDVAGISVARVPFHCVYQKSVNALLWFWPFQSKVTVHTRLRVSG
jgi:hypothetical protein